MFISQNRAIKFPLSRSLVSEVETPDESVSFPFAWSTEDSDERVNVLMELSLNEYIALSSAIDVGSDIAYGEEAINVWWTWVRSLNSMSICEAIINCIESDADTQATLLQYLSNAGIQPVSGDNPPTPVSPSQSAENLLPDGYTCDNDHLFGMARWIVTQLDLSTRQVLEAIELLTNDVELASVFADNVEGVSWFGSGLELAAWLQDQLIQWYDAAYTPTNEDLLACEIFCIIKETCEVSIDNILQAYSGNSFGVPTDVNDWLSVLDWLVGTTFDGSIGTVATYHYFILQALRFASKLPIFDGLRGLKMIIGMGADETDSDWSILCDDCPEEGWCFTFDFTTGEHGWDGYGTGTDYAQYVAGQGFRRGVGLPARFVVISPVFTGTLTEVAATYSEPYTPTVSGAEQNVFRNSPNLKIILVANYPTNFTSYDLPTDTPTEMSSTYLRIGISSNPASSASPAIPTTMLLTSVTLRGTGTPPTFAEGTEC